MEEENKVEFLEEEEIINEKRGVRKAASAMAAWLIKKRIARDEKTANKILVAIIIAAFLLTGYILIKQF